MKKMIVLLTLVCLTLLMSGCGCLDIPYVPCL